MVITAPEPQAKLQPIAEQHTVLRVSWARHP